MYNRIYDLYCDVSNYLIQKLDAEGFDESEPVEQYLKVNDPDMYAIYCVLDAYINKKKER